MHPLIHNNLFVKNTHYSTGFFGSARVRIGPQQSAEKGPALVRAGPVRSAFETLPVLRLFWCPRDLTLNICLSALEDDHTVYTRCIGRMHSLATTSGPARKVGVVSIFKMACLEQTLLNLSSSKIR